MSRKGGKRGLVIGSSAPAVIPFGVSLSVHLVRQGRSVLAAAAGTEPAVADTFRLLGAEPLSFFLQRQPQSLCTAEILLGRGAARCPLHEVIGYAIERVIAGALARCSPSDGGSFTGFRRNAVQRNAELLRFVGLCSARGTCP